MAPLRTLLTACAAVLVGPALAGCLSSGEAAAADSCRDLEVTISGTDGDDRLRGTPGRDVIAGGEGDDRIQGLGGDDVLCGGPGADRLDGGDGDDVVDGGADKRETVDTESYEWRGDTLVGGRGDDRLVAGPTGSHGAVDTITYADAPDPVQVELGAARATGDGSDRFEGRFGTLLGTRGDDVLLGSDRGEQISGGLGADRIDGRGGDDRIDGAGVPRVMSTSTPLDLSRNVLLGGEGDDEISGAFGDDRILGGPGKDNLAGGAGRDRVLGGAGDDQVYDEWAAPGEGDGAELDDGGPGRDRLLAILLRPGPPSLDVGVFRDAVGTIDLARGTVRATVGSLDLAVDARGFEDLETPFGTWTVRGTDGPNDIIAGDEKHPVRIFALGGDDDLAGSFQDDLLDGGPGRDTAIPYVGRDRLVSIEKRID